MATRAIPAWPTSPRPSTLPCDPPLTATRCGADPERRQLSTRVPEQTRLRHPAPVGLPLEGAGWCEPRLRRVELRAAREQVLRMAFEEEVAVVQVFSLLRSASAELAANAQRFIRLADRIVGFGG